MSGTYTKSRFATQRQIVLEALRQQPTTSHEFLMNNIPRFSARIYELRKAGYKIEGKPISDTNWVFTLTEEPEPPITGRDPGDEA